MQSLIRPELRPVVNFEPWELIDEFHLPDNFHLLSDSERESLMMEFVQAVFLHHGLPELKAMVPGSTYVAMEALEFPHWHFWLRHQLAEIALADWEDQLPMLPGGWMLLEAGRVQIYPGCCSDLGNLEDWKSLLNQDVSDEWIKLWNGHPWHCCQVRAESFVLSQAGDGHHEYLPQFEIARLDWHEMLAQAEPFLAQGLAKMQIMLKQELPQIDAEAFSQRWLSV